MIDILMLLILGVVTWCVASEGAWGAGLTFLSVLFAGLLAMNWFEPLAEALSGMAPGWAYHWDIVALLGLFAGFVFLFRFITESLMPTYVEVQALVYNVARWGFAVATGYVVVAVLMTSLHTAPLPRSFMGFDPGPGRKQFFGLGPDIQWLALTQYISEKSLSKSQGPVFDAVAFERIPGKPETMQMWSSFPIRYATRRESFMTGGVVSSSSAPPGSSGTGPPPTQSPSGPTAPAF